MGREVKEQRQKMRKGETVTVDLLHRAVPAKHTDEGLRALSGEKKAPLATITFILTPTTPGMLIFSRKDQEYWAGGAGVPG